MNKYIVLSLCVSLSAVLCEYLNREEGDECEWEGRKGRCVKESRCITTLDDDSPKHPVCSKNLGEKVICCTDCNLVNSTKNAVFIPPSGLIWKNGQKARDSCLQYLQDLPYKCKEDGLDAGITRDLDDDNGCYEYSEWEVDSSSSEVKKPRAEYPHKVLLGYSLEWLTSWGPGGFIISDKYIVTTATAQIIWGKLQVVAVGVSNHWDSTSWQTHFVKRFIPHPEFDNWNRYFNDIALIETETRIKFNENVLPACLHVEKDASVENAITTFRLKRCDENESLNLTDSIKTEERSINLKEFSEDECKATYNWIVGYDHKTQICYGHKIFKRYPSIYCLMVDRDPLLITTQYSSCVHTAIGVSIPVLGCKDGFCQMFTRVSHYVPWIESIVWPDES